MTNALLPYALLLAGLMLAAGLQGGKDHLARAAVLFLLTWTLLESVWTLIQILREGVATYQYPFIITGSFHNPAPFGALNGIGLATAASCIVRYRSKQDPFSRILLILSFTVAVPASIALILSRSRAAWLGLLIALTVLLYRETDFRAWIRRHRGLFITALVLLLAAGAGMFLMKPDSALGRLHIWNMECRVIAGHPWTGVGYDRIFKAYGDVQSAYFRQAERPDFLVRVADSPVYVFNEYLKFGMAWGIGGLLLSAAVAAWVVWRLLRKRSLLACGALLYAVFAFASFPLSVVQLRLLGTVLLACALTADGGRHRRWLLLPWGLVLAVCIFFAYRAYPQEKARRDAEQVWRASLFLDLDTGSMLERFQPLYPHLKDNAMFLYQYGYLLQQAGSYEESNRILQEGVGISCDPVLHTALAENHFALGHFDQAEAELIRAHWLVPGRIAPLLALMRLYAASGRPADAIRTGRAIRRMPVYADNPQMTALYEQAMLLLDELEGTIEPKAPQK
ncbi:MAG: O-antigen ligase family protein [Bacteroidales bacterium]|nr:O-antigen ligase family protein [Bacteroidales bacterium]